MTKDKTPKKDSSPNRFNEAAFVNKEGKLWSAKMLPWKRVDGVIVFLEDDE